ncbi:hypothetical protein PINS_up023966, partial [Pythium insidiosum]
MASIAASPGFPEALKKRSRLLSGDAYDLPSRLKRVRAANTASGVEDRLEDDTTVSKDLPKYTQRHVDYFEQVKQAEIARIRTEYEQYIMKRDLEFQQARHEIARLQDHAVAQDREVQRLQGENKLLKRAITIQNQQKEECLSENNMLKQLATAGRRPYQAPR